VRIDPWKPPGLNDVEMAAVCALYRQGLASATPPISKSGATARNEVEAMFQVPKTAGFIVRSMGDRVDAILFFRFEPPVVKLLHVGVRDQREGRGSALVKHLRDLCAQKGVKELRCSYSQKDERVKKFLAKNGFTGEKADGEVAPGFPRVEAAAAVPAAAST
jgi:hypothetical protein